MRDQGYKEYHVIVMLWSKNEEGKSLVSRLFALTNKGRDSRKIGNKRGELVGKSKTI